MEVRCDCDVGAKPTVLPIEEEARRMAAVVVFISIITLLVCKRIMRSLLRDVAGQWGMYI